MQETRVWSLVWEDPLEKEMAIHSSILAWKAPWTGNSYELQSMGWQFNKTLQLNNDMSIDGETKGKGMINRKSETSQFF